MKKDEFKKWVREHKKGILIGVEATVALIALKPLSKSLKDRLWEQKLPLDLETGRVDSATEYKDLIELLIDGVKISDMGDFGKELSDKLPNIPKNAKFAVLLDYQK